MKITQEEKIAFQKVVKYYRNLASDIRTIKTPADYQIHCWKSQELESAGIHNINNGSGVYVLTF